MYKELYLYGLPSELESSKELKFLILDLLYSNLLILENPTSENKFLN